MTKRAWYLLTERAKLMLLHRNPGLQSKVARKLVVSHAAVSRTWWGKAKSARILAEILKVVKS